MGAVQAVFNSVLVLLSDEAAFLDHLVNDFIFDALGHVDGAVHIRNLFSVGLFFDVVAQVSNLGFQVVVFFDIDLSEVLNVPDRLQSTSNSLIFDHDTILRVFV